jgi:putative transposase
MRGAAVSFANIVGGAFIKYINQRWDFQRRQGARTEWRSDTTYEVVNFTDFEMQKRIRLGEIVLYDGDGACPVEGKPSAVHGLTKVSPEDLEEGRRALIYVLAIHDAGLYGTKNQPEEWKACIKDTWSRYGQQWTRLRGRRMGNPVSAPSLKTVHRLVVKGGKEPTLEKLTPRHRHKGNRDRRYDEDFLEFIIEKVDDQYLRRPAINIHDFKAWLEVETKKENVKRAAADLSAFPVAGVTAIENCVAEFDQEEVVKRRYGEQAAFIKYGSAEAQKAPAAPLDRAEFDATVTDLFVVDDEMMLPIGRATVVAGKDRCTGMPLSWTVTFEKPSILALAQSIRNAVLSKDYVQELNETAGWSIRHPCETFGVPRTLVLDRGLENLAESIAVMGAKLGMNRILIMSRKKPWLKGAIERMLRTMSEAVLHIAPGTTFHNALMKMGYDPKKDTVITVSALDHALHKFFIDIYPRGGERTHNNRRRIDVWRDLTRKSPVKSVGDVQSVNHLFGRTEYAVPGRHGINYENMQFFSKRLLTERTSAKFEKALARQGGEIQFHANPADLGAIYVVLPHLDETIRVPVAPKWTDYATGLSLWHHRRIREFARESSRNANELDALTECKAELIAMMREQMQGRRGTVRAAQTVARMEGVNRVARAGTDTSTTVPGSDAHTRQEEAKALQSAKDAVGKASRRQPPQRRSGRRGKGPGTAATKVKPVDTSAAGVLDARDSAPLKKKGYMP